MESLLTSSKMGVSPLKYLVYLFYKERATHEWRWMEVSLARMELLVLLRREHHVGQRPVLVDVLGHLDGHRHRGRGSVLGDHLNGGTCK